MDGSYASSLSHLLKLPTWKFLSAAKPAPARDLGCMVRPETELCARNVVGITMDDFCSPEKEMQQNREMEPQRSAVF
jgi:hypothetical protein